MINILPYNQKKVIERIRRIRIFTTLIWGIITIIIIAGALLVPTLITISSRYRLANSQIEVFESGNTVVKAVDVASLEDRINKLSEKLAAPSLGTPIVYINEIKGMVSKGIDITSLVVSDVTTPNTLVQGVANTREDLQNFISKLEDNENVASVDSPVSNFVKSTNAAFNITVVFKKKL